MKLNRFDSVNLSEVYLGCQVLSHLSFCKYLGKYVDQSLSFKEHVARLNNNMSSQLGLLCRVQNNLTLYVGERVFTTMIFPMKLNYYHFVWNNWAPLDINL